MKRFFPVFLVLSISLALICTAFIYWPYRFGISDAVAQFFPSGYAGLASYKYFDLPLYNWNQHLGIPLLGTGYYPVVDPVFWFSSAFSTYVVNNPQLTWDITCSSYMVLAALGSYLYLVRCFGISPLLAVVGSISWAFSGVAVFVGGEWIYILASFGYIPLIMILIDRWMLSRNVVDAVWIGLAAIFFLMASNVQIVFYALHLVIVLIFTLPAATKRLKTINAYEYVGLVLIVLGFCAGYIYLLLMTVGASTRELGAVTLDKYYWLQYDWHNVLKYSFFPYQSAWNFMGTGGLYFQGPWVVLGMLLSPIACLVLKWEERCRILLLLGGAVIFFMLSIGSEGGIGGLLYHVKPYNMFRHSVKWAPFFQMMSVILAIYTIDRLLKLEKLKFIRTFTFALFLAVQVPIYIYFIAAYDNAHSQRLTEVSFPIKFDKKHFDSRYRIASLWDKGELYKSRYPEPLLGYNFASFFGLFQIAGYEPMIPRKNLEHVKGNWHPGYYTNVNDFDLDRFVKYSLKWILVPQSQLEMAMNVLGNRFPSIPLKAGPVLDMEPKVQIIEVSNPLPLVHAENATINSFETQGNSVFAELGNLKENSKIIFSWVANDDFHVFVNGTETHWEEDKFGRVSVSLQPSTFAFVELKYFPRNAMYAFFAGIAILVFGLMHFRACAIGASR